MLLGSMLKVTSERVREMSFLSVSMGPVMRGEELDDPRRKRDVFQGLRVLVADDYEPWRRCVSSLFSRHPELQIVMEVSDGLEAVLKTEELQPDLVLLDLSLPKLNGVEAASRIRQTTPATKIVFITAYRDSEAIDTVLRNKADGYVLKWEITRDLLPAIETVVWGGKFVSPRLTEIAS